MERRWWISLLLAAALIGHGTAAQAAWPGQYRDVMEWPGWAIKGKIDPHDGFIAWGGDLAEAVYWELMIGDPPPDGKRATLRDFRPNHTISRGEYASILARVLGVDLPAHAPGEEWFRPAVEALGIRGVIVRLGNFNEPILRRELGEWMGRSLVWYGVAVADRKGLDFIDLKGVPEAPYILRAAQADVIKGYPDGTFGIDRSATRTEAAAMAVRLAKQLKQHPPDSGLFLSEVQASWAAITEGERQVGQGKSYAFSHLLEPYYSELNLYGPNGYDVGARGYFDLRQAKSYRALVDAKVKSILARDTIALVLVTDRIQRVDLDGRVIYGPDRRETYVYYFKRGDHWVEGNSKVSSEYPAGALPKPEGNQ